MLEKMGEFFDNRLDMYEDHQLNEIESAREFYRFTARCLPEHDGARILDLGCGTGLELGFYFEINPRAEVTGIDLAEGMLRELKEKFADKNITVIWGSYFDIPFEVCCYDAAVSVESLHHFTQEEKTGLYRRIAGALTEGGYYILTDYFAQSDESESAFRTELTRLKKEQGINDDEFYHFDTPLTLEHEIQALNEAGFSSVEVLGRWGDTCTIRASKRGSMPAGHCNRYIRSIRHSQPSMI